MPESPKPAATDTVITDFPGGKRVVARYRGFEIVTDQPTTSGGEGSAPSPFDVFLGSLATCAGYFVLEFCQKRGIPTEGVRIEQTIERDADTRAVHTVRQTIVVPADFPAKYRGAVQAAAEHCSVKKLVQHAPRFELAVVTES